VDDDEGVHDALRLVLEPDYAVVSDDGTGIYYYRARYYHPQLQRFISEDPIGVGGGGWPDLDAERVRR
jgi:uncharacterized protein RhaS with RHS repeats